MGTVKPRIYLLDNVKALLILLVVVGHFVTQYTGSSELMRSLFIIIYSFHMPLFIFVSGLFAKSSFKDGNLRVNKIISFLILYVSLKIIIFVEDLAFGGSDKFRLFYEAGIPWYMFAMTAFICLTYIFRNVKPWIMITASVFLALIAGYETGVGDILCLSRIIVFYPFFLAGYYTDVIKFSEFTRKIPLRIMAAIILVLLIFLAFYERDALYSMRPLITGRSPFAKLPIPALGAVYRLGYYIVAALISFSVICVLPKSKNALSYVGASTLAIYFLHRPILYLLMDLGYGDLLQHTCGGAWIYIFLATGVILTLILSIKPLRAPFNKLMKLDYGGLFR